MVSWELCPWPIFVGRGVLRILGIFLVTPSISGFEAVSPVSKTGWEEARRGSG